MNGQIEAWAPRIGLDQEMFEHRGFTRLKQLEYLIASGQIDKDFFWTAR